MAFDPEKYKPRPLKNIGYAEFHKGVFTKLNQCLYLPSRIEALSIVTEFVKKWILSLSDKYKANLWNAVAVNGCNPMVDIKFSNWSVKDWLKRSPPRLQIGTENDLSFNNDSLDDDFGSLSVHFDQGFRDRAFVKDKKNNVYIALQSRLNEVKGTITIELRTQAEQQDLYDFLYHAMRANKTMTLYPDLNFYVPRKLMTQIASDLKFEVNEDGDAVDERAFLNYLNSVSCLTFVKKIRTINRKNEYYIHIPEWLVHIRDISLSHDNGEQVDMIYTNYRIEGSFTVRMPSPKYFIYFSQATFESTMYRDATDMGKVKVVDVNINPIPDTNEKGWRIYISGDFTQENKDTPLVVDLNQLFYVPNGNENDILDVIAFCKDQVINPEVFIDVKVYNNRKLLTTKVDWTTNTLVSKNITHDQVSKICVYTDHLYMNNVLTEIRGLNQGMTDRIDAKDDTQFQP